ncbi:MAG: neutral trehalase [Bacillus sp. (in: Bacteria)]|nr:neutral trehalase [Bacillus sp. (in: firmicutes)]
MRLWHYKLIPYLPKSQLLAQWRELNSIFKKQDKHILINYIYEYPQMDLLIYSEMVIGEMEHRGYKVETQNFDDYFNIVPYDVEYYEPFKNHHTDRYLLQCFYNLQEKYDRGQKDFTEQQYKELEQFVKKEIKKKGEKR